MPRAYLKRPFIAFQWLVPRESENNPGSVRELKTVSSLVNLPRVSLQLGQIQQKWKYAWRLLSDASFPQFIRDYHIRDAVRHQLLVVRVCKAELKNVERKELKDSKLEDVKPKKQGFSAYKNNENKINFNNKRSFLIKSKDSRATFRLLFSSVLLYILIKYI